MGRRGKPRLYEEFLVGATSLVGFQQLSLLAHLFEEGLERDPRLVAEQVQQSVS